MKTIEKYSIGTGDRFGHQGAAQIAAVKNAREKGVDVAIVWNKSNREHLLSGTKPADQGAVASVSWALTSVGVKTLRGNGERT